MRLHVVAGSYLGCLTQPNQLSNKEFAFPKTRLIRVFQRNYRKRISFSPILPNPSST